MADSLSNAPMPSSSSVHYTPVDIEHDPLAEADDKPLVPPPARERRRCNICCCCNSAFCFIGLLLLALTLSLSQFILELAGYNMRVVDGTITVEYDRLSSAEDEELIRNLEHTVLDDNGLIQVTFTTLNSDISRLQQQIADLQTNGLPSAASENEQSRGGAPGASSAALAALQTALVQMQTKVADLQSQLRSGGSSDSHHTQTKFERVWEVLKDYRQRLDKADRVIERQAAILSSLSGGRGFPTEKGGPGDTPPSPDLGLGEDEPPVPEEVEGPNLGETSPEPDIPEGVEPPGPDTEPGTEPGTEPDVPGENSSEDADRECEGLSTAEDLPPAAQEWKQRVPRRVHSLLVLFSAYRVNPTTIAATGIFQTGVGPTPLGGCRWVGRKVGESIEGIAAMRIQEEREEEQNKTVVITCVLDRPTSTCGGYLEATFESVPVVLYRDERAEPISPPVDLPLRLTHCSPLMNKPLNPKLVREWVDYHRVVAGVDKWHVYDGGQWFWHEDELRPYLESERMEVTEISWSSGIAGRGLALQDCLYRSIFASKWIVHTQLNEYLLPLAPSASIPSILQDHEDFPWISFGAAMFSPVTCDGPLSDARFGVEVAVYREPEVFCAIPTSSKAFCGGSEGHRRYFANPRKVQVLGVYSVQVPKTGKLLNSETDLRLNFYDTLYDAHNPNSCRDVVTPDTVIDGLVRDVTLAGRIPAVRDCPLENDACVESWP